MRSVHQLNNLPVCGVGAAFHRSLPRRLLVQSDASATRPVTDFPGTGLANNRQRFATLQAK